MNIGRVFKALGPVVAYPVTTPARLITQGAENTMHAAILGLIRHALTYAGGLAFAGDDLTQFVGAAATLIGLVWSLVDKRRNATA